VCNKDEKLIKLPSLSGKTRVKNSEPISLTGDRTMDSLIGQLLEQLSGDRDEADDLYEQVKELSENQPDNAQMQNAAISALKLKNTTTQGATKLVEMAARIKMSNNRRSGFKNSRSVNAGDNKEDENILDIINDSNDEEEDNNETC